ncbi:MAG: group III truncated hemoglobin [Xanthobacteraceae bacterium]|nr:group III truncated hemoglobin [Xanthobacteraceae bacterium]
MSLPPPVSATTPFKHHPAESGLTESLVRKVIVSFYENVRDDALLGPIFSEAIGENWDSHIERVARFWLTATRLGSGYDGRNFMPAHRRHSSIRADHLSHWLALFRATAAHHCPPQAALALVDIAERMAETLQISLARRDIGQ